MPDSLDRMREEVSAGGEISAENPIERILFAKVEAWILVALMIAGVIVLLSFGWLVQHRVNGGEKGGILANIAVLVARFPDPVIQFLDGDAVVQPQRLKHAAALDAGYPTIGEYGDRGTLILSSYSDDYEVSTVSLLDLQTGETRHRWAPPVEAINSVTHFTDAQNLKRNYRTQHPLLMENGDLVFTSGEGPLVRIDACGGIVWTIDRHFHHSIERDSDGDFIVPLVTGTATGTAPPLRDDGFAKVSPDGEILAEWSVTDILQRNGYHGLVYGVGPWESDRIHLNDAEPILHSDGFVEEGDIALSIRHLSTVLLYRPKTDEIVWLETGPWLNQHDVDYQGDGVFTVFGNDSVRGPEAKDMALRGYSTIWQYDMKTGETGPFLEMKNPKVFTATQGLHRVLPNGDVFVEQQNAGLLYRLTANGVAWQHSNRLDSEHIGAVHWSRYLTQQESHFPWLASLSCTRTEG